MHQLFRLTPAQQEWLKANEKFRPAEHPRDDLVFLNHGVLHADGRFDMLLPGASIEIDEGAIWVGIPHIRNR